MRPPKWRATSSSTTGNGRHATAARDRSAVKPILAQFAHSRPSYHTEYVQWFGEHLEFDCPANRFYFHDQTATLPMQTRHHGMLELLTQELDRRISAHRHFTGWSATVAESVWRALGRNEVPIWSAWPRH